MLSVIVVNWNGRQHLHTCLSALERQTYTEREIVLVDNGSSDGSPDYVEAEFPQVRVLRLPKNLGFCGGNNVGIRQSQGEWVALINNDTEADPDWLTASLVAIHKEQADFAAARLRLFDQRAYLDTAGDLYFRTGYPGKRGWLLPDGPEYDQNEWVFGACAGAVVYRRTMLDEIGLFDKDFFSLMEDIDLSFRAQLAGYRCLYVASALVYHKVGATVGRDTARRQYWSHRNHWHVLLKNLPLPLLLRYLGQIMAAEALVLGSAAQRGRLSVFARARTQVVRDLPRILAKRKSVQALRRVSLQYIDSLIRKDWFSFRLAVKRREAEFARGKDGE